MTIPEDSRPPEAGVWQRHLFHAPRAAWLPEALEKMKDVAVLPPLRGLAAGPENSLVIEEYRAPDLQPLAAYLATAAAPLWVLVSIVEQSLTGVGRMHECGLLHGAISVETMLIDSRGGVVMTNVGAGFAPPEWRDRGVPAGALLQSLALHDLSDLGRVFRILLSGDPEMKLTVSRPDIAPMVAEWIDWLAAPEKGREPASATQAYGVFADIRAGKAGLRPWQNKLELPPEIEFGGPRHPAVLSEEERKKLLRAAAHAHGSGLSVRAQVLLAALILALIGGAIWITNHFFGKKSENPVAEEGPLRVPATVGGPGLMLADEPDGLYEATGGDVEPVADTRETIARLMEIVGKDLKPDDRWKKELARQKEELEKGPNGSFPVAGPGSYLYDTRIFPALGKPSAGAEPGDYYLVWRTRGLVMTPEECGALQSAILRCARYCGVRILAWTVLPNQAAVILRVLPRHPLPDEKLERRIGILRDDKVAASVISRINAKLKEGDEAGADMLRRQWTGSMGNAGSFYNLVKTMPVVAAAALQGRPLWQDKPLHLSLLNPEVPEVLPAAAIVDTAAQKGQLVAAASAWPLCNLRAALHNYGPALRAISVLMQKNPQASLPLPTKEEISRSLVAYRRYLGDAPPEPGPKSNPAAPAVSTPGPPPSKGDTSPPNNPPAKNARTASPYSNSLSR